MAKKILIIDDDPYTVRYLETLLQDHGYDTCYASDGEAAYDVLAKEDPDLITLDLAMPREWGPRFYRRMSKKAEFKDKPVIIISGMAGRDHAIRKVVATFSKPFDADELLRVVKQTIG